MPLRRRAKARSQSPPKRNASGASSPGKTLTVEDADSAYNDMLAPASMEMDGDKVRKMISDFRMACIAEGKQGCAISGGGARWCNAQSVGPGIQACHIVPQQHYHIYPIQDDGDRLAALDGHPPVTERLKAAWLSTWSPANSILLMKHIHDFFDARLVSIHPETLLIRVFVPYEDLEPYHGRKARLSDMVHHLALRHHYDMCCIENMAARRPSADVTSPTASQRSASGASLVSTGASTPFSGRTGLPATPGSGHTSTLAGDPSKRRRAAHHDPGLPADGDAESWGDDEHELHQRKRLRLEKQYGLDGYITPDNSNDFLTNVNWKLSRFKTRD